MNKITLENFRCFRQKQEARLAPLTLLVGENSTGKTSFLALIRVLWDVAFQQVVPDFKDDPYDLGTFDEIAHHRGAKGSRERKFEVGFSVTQKSQNQIPSPFDYRFEVEFRKGDTGPTPVRRLFARGDMQIEDLKKGTSPLLKYKKLEREWSMPVRSSYIRRFLGPENRLHSISYLLWRILTEEDDARSLANSDHRPSQQELHEVRKIVRMFERVGPRYIGLRPFACAPVRSKPRRTYDPARLTWDSEGEYAPMYLASVHFQDKPMWLELKASLENFGRQSGLFDEILVKRFGNNENEPFQIQIRKFGGRLKGPPRNLIDVGYGVSQILPVITELLRHGAPNTFLIQQPEVHLHPSAQAALGSLFCELAGAKRQLVVETHSDYLLDRVRMDVRDGKSKLKPEDVSILFFERGDLDVRIHSLKMDNNGNILDAPKGYREFFLKETRRSMKL